MRLTDPERDRFASYLEEDARTSEGLAEQAEKLGLAGSVMAKKLRLGALAAKIVAAGLRRTETMEVGS